MTDEQQIDSTTAPKVQAQTGQYVMEKNLIFAQSDYLRIFTYDDKEGAEKLVLRTEFAINDKIVDILKIPTDQFQQKSQLGGLSGMMAPTKNLK